MTVQPILRDEGAKVADTRELRALELFERHGHRIERVAADVYLVPSQDGRRAYRVVYGKYEESCSCPDHEYRGVNCVHIYAVGISLAKRRGASRSKPCACLNGMVFIGHTVEDPDTGDAVEVVEAAPCRRCRTA